MTNDIIHHYDLLVDEGNDPVQDPEPLREYMDKWDGQDFINAMQLDKTKNVLEIGVGTGRLAVRVAPLCDKFYGIDILPKTINRAKENLSGSSNVNLICADFMNHYFSEQFDVIYSSLTFMYIGDKHQAIQKTYDLLKNGGRFVLSIDKNQNKFIDTGKNKISIFPDNPKSVAKYIADCEMKIKEQFETEFGYVFVAVR